MARWLKHTVMVASISISAVTTKRVDVTVDDTFGDEVTGKKIIYSPGEWNVGQECPECSLQPNPARASRETWHDASLVGAEATYTFTGSAVYVYCTLAISDYWGSNLLFYIDDQLSGNFLTSFEAFSSTYEYQQLVYSTDQLPAGSHTIKIRNGKSDSPGSALLLDYLKYSYEEEITTTDTPRSESSTTSHSSRTISVSTSVLLTTIVNQTTVTARTALAVSTSATVGISTKRSTSTPPSRDIDVTSSVPSSTSSPAPSESPLETLLPAQVSDSTKATFSAGAIAGVAIGSVVAALVMVFLAICVRRRFKKTLEANARLTPIAYDKLFPISDHPARLEVASKHLENHDIEPDRTSTVKQPRTQLSTLVIAVDGIEEPPPGYISRSDSRT